MLTTIDELRTWSRRRHAEGKRIGLVPTMGALHDGHLSLVRASRECCDATVVSIFVNPTQFGPNEDFHRYPRPLENDLKLLESVGAPEVFAPSVDEMYPEGFDASIRIGGVTAPWEGRSRPAHFDGVATVVLKLFLAGEADAAFFGQKDFQQLCVVRKMVSDLNVPVEIVACPIVREADGLAMSSRNRYLSPSYRSQALVLSRSLIEAERQVVVEGVRDVEVLRRAIRAVLETAPDIEIDYIALADPKTLEEPATLDGPEIVVLLAAKFGTTRLIDNMLIRISS